MMTMTACFVMPGLVPGIHDFDRANKKDAMTARRQVRSGPVMTSFAGALVRVCKIYLH
jgi:hypothetical protein